MLHKVKGGLGQIAPVERGKVRSTTILCVRRENRVAIASDGQVTVGSTIMKSNARKLRRIYHDRVLAGFAGARCIRFFNLSYLSFFDTHYTQCP